MATFILVPGYWLGGWAWEEVATALRFEGHKVYAATLTGLGERRHLGGPQVNLDTHVEDILNLIRFEQLEKVILVGHSYASLVITSVADRIPERLSQLIYVDTAPMPSGAAQIDFYTEEKRATYKRQVAEWGSGWRLPLPSWEELDEGNVLKDMGQQERERMRERATDMPFNAALQPCQLTNPARTRLPKAAVWCTSTSDEVKQLIASGNPMFQELAGSDWRFKDLSTGHWPMFSKPRELAAILHVLVDGR